MKTKTLYVKLLHLFLFFSILTNTNSLFAQNTGTLTGVPTFQSIGLYWSGSGGNANTVCNVKYRIVGSSSWINGFPLWFDNRAHNAGDVSGYTGIVLPANQYRGSIVGLNAGTNYEVQLTAGASIATTTITTWAETSAWPVSATTTVTNSSAQLNITTSGTANGYRLYTGNATIDVANGAAHCIYINAAYVIIRGLTLKGASEDAIRLGPQARDVVIENCDISGWGAATFSAAYNSFPNTHSGVRIRGKAGNDATSTENCYNVTRVVVQRNKIHDPRGTAQPYVGNTYPYGPQGVNMQEAGGNMVIRYNDIYGSDAKHFQDGIGGLNNFTKSGFPRDNTDIYGNKISHCWDDGIESEGANCNVRIYGNFLDNTFTGIATASTSIGPLYVYRNITHTGRRLAIGTSNGNLDTEDRGPFNKCGSQNSVLGGRTYLFHNTVLQPTQSGFANTRGLNGGIMDNGGGPVQNTFSRNNIWTSAYQGQGGRSIAENNNGSGVGCTYQFDVCGTSNVLQAGVANNIMSGNPTYAAGVPVAPLAVNAGPRTQGYDLATNSIGYNAGTVLPNFNDGFIGTAPDAGAYESGKPLLEFGVNAYLPPSNGNTPPVANAGNDITMTLPTNSATLTGSGTDADGTIASYTWTRISGPATFTLANVNAAVTVLSNLVQGVYVFRLTVTDNGGATGTDDITVTVNAAANQAPTANAGSDVTLTLPVNSTTLLGSGADADGTIVSYAWVRVSGPTAFALGTANAATSTLSNLVAGTYVFRLTVTDNGGATGTDNVTVTVTAAANQPPTANAGSDVTLTLPVNSTTLLGSGSDADGTITGYAWARVSGPTTFTLGTANAATSTLSNLVAGTYVFRLTVTDNGGAVATDNVTVIVNAAANQPPTANAGSDITLTLPINSTTLNGSGSDPDGTIVSYAWARVSGPTTFTLANANAASTGLSNLVQGTYVFRLTVTDNSGAAATDNVTVIVNAAANQPPAANAGNNITLTLPANSTTLTGSGTDADGTIASYAWIRVSGPATFTLANANTATTGLSNLVQGTYVFRLTVTDNNGATGTDDVTVTVNAAANQPPTANAGSNIVITLPTSSTTLTGSGTDPDGTIASYAWTRISGPTTFTLANANAAATGLSNLVQGVYTFRLTVTDNSGAVATDDVTVTVNASSPSNQAPVAIAGNNITLNLPANSATLNGTGSFDPDGTIVSYAWTRISGPTAFTLANANAATTGLSNLVAGTYIFRLRVTDNNGATDDDNITVIVSATANQPPIANAGNNITLILPVNSTNLTGSGTDADGAIASYVWTRVSGPATFTLANVDAATTGLSNLVQGTYVFRLTVTDNDGATATDDITVTVNAAPNQSPTANAGSDITLTLPLNSTILTGSGFDPDGTIAGYVWSRVSGPATFIIVNANTASTGLNGLVQGTYVFRLTVTDNNGATATDNVNVTVNAATAAPNQSPTANAGSDITLVLPINSAILTGNGYDPDGTIVSYAWTRVSGPATFTIVSATTAATGLNGLVQGTYVFRLTVTDNSGATVTDIVTVTVSPSNNQAPTANAGADITITLPTNTATLYGSGSDQDGTIASYTWARVSGPATYTLANTSSATSGLYDLVQGVYVFRLTITDNRGATATDAVTVTVNAATPPTGNQPPTARTENDIVITLPVNSTLLHGNTSSDPDGIIVSYLWTQQSGPGQAVISNGQMSIATVSDLTTGIYTFELKVTDDDGAASVKTIRVTVENQRGQKAIIKVYPNPTSGILNMQYVENANGKFRITIYDANRRLMRDEVIDKTQISITKTMDVSLFGPGVYFIQVTSPDNRKVVKPFVKM